MLLPALVACGGNVPEDDPTVAEPIYEEPTLPTEEYVYEPIPVEIPQHNEYIVTLEVDPETRTVQGISRISFTNRTGQPLDTIVLRIFLNAFDQDVDPRPYAESVAWRLREPEGRRGYMEMEYVFVNNEAVTYVMDDTVLTLYLEEALAPDSTVYLSLQYSAYVPAFGHIIGGNDAAMWFGMFLPVLSVFEEDGWHTAAFYPVGNPFFLEVANYQVAVTAPLAYNVVGTGHRTEEIIYDNDIKITRFVANMTRDFAFAVLSPEYEHVSAVSDSGVEINFYYRTLFAGERAAEILATARDSMEQFERHVGVYPFGQIDLVETEIIYDSAALSQMIFVDARLLRNGDLQTLSHSLGRHWFANVVGINPIEEPWLDVGLTRFIQATIAQDTSELLREYMEAVHEVIAPRTDLYLTDGLWHYSNWEEFVMVHEQRAMLMLYQLLQRMGEEDFWAFINLYYQTYSFQIATVQDFIHTAEEVYGSDLQEFFNVWMTSDVVPPLR
jgi:hypothetical protein